MSSDEYAERLREKIKFYRELARFALKDMKKLEEKLRLREKELKKIMDDIKRYKLGIEMLKLQRYDYLQWASDVQRDLKKYLGER